jgi:hypothetical protein
MADRYKASTIIEYEHKGEKKTKFVNLGWGFVTKKGNIMFNLDALPVNGKLIIMKHEPRDNYDRRPRNDYQDSGRGYREDEAPF